MRLIKQVHDEVANLARLELLLKVEIRVLLAGFVVSAPQTRARRNVARGVEVLRGTPPPRHRARRGRRGRQSSCSDFQS